MHTDCTKTTFLVRKLTPSLDFLLGLCEGMLMSSLHLQSRLSSMNIPLALLGTIDALSQTEVFANWEVQEEDPLIQPSYLQHMISGRAYVLCFQTADQCLLFRGVQWLCLMLARCFSAGSLP